MEVEYSPMRVPSTLQWPETPFARLDYFGTVERSVVALDVEWTKNYMVKNGSRPFCYSLVLVRWPENDNDLSTFPTTFGFKSVYLSESSDESALVAELDRDLQSWLSTDSVLTGHQLLTLNLRHSLSTALVACLGLGLVGPGSRNINDLLHQEAWDLVEYVRIDQFKSLLSPHPELSPYN
jgi:hypothetical protein